MAYIIGNVYLKDIEELRRRGWVVETAPTDFHSEEKVPDEKTIMVYVDSDLIDIMSGPDWTVSPSSKTDEEKKQPVTQDEIDWILKMAEDELDHLERDSELDKDCMEDYKYSKDVLERVREYLTTQGGIKS